ncbi:hypothetical protein G3M48_002682, partial [Beauveria asiatica]
MTVLTRHSKRQKEAVRKRSPSLRDKAQQMGLKGSIHVLVIYEDPTHGVKEYDKTRQTPHVRLCRKYASPHQNVLKISMERLQDKEVRDDEAVIMSMVSAGSESADIEDMGSVDCIDGVTDVAVTGFEERPESLDGHSDDDLALVDLLITRQLEET